MTENEVIKIIGNNATEKEINLKTLYQLVEKFNRGHWGDIQLFEDEENRYSSVIEKVIEEIQQYRAIGTIEEFKALKEKNVSKKPRFYAHNYYCTECGNLVGNNEFEWQRFLYCDKCGQKLDWQ